MADCIFLDMPCASAMAAKSAASAAASASVSTPSAIRAASAESTTAAAFADGELDLKGFRELVRMRDPGNSQTDAELDRQFVALDVDVVLCHKKARARR